MTVALTRPVLPNPSRRSVLRAAVGSAAAAILAGVGQSEDASVAVPNFRVAGDRDDSQAFARAIAANPNVHIPQGGGSGPNGHYLISDVALRTGTRLFGDGIGRTIVRPVPTAGAAIFGSTASGAAQIGNLQIRDLTLQGWAVERGFAEHSHLLELAGVRDVMIERVAFLAFQGDGAILSSGRDWLERHNRAVTFRDCRFDGINRQNRNGLSVIDGEDVRVEGCSFARCTRPEMPGAIDFEPDATPFSIIRNVAVRNCRFSEIGGNVAIIGMQIPAAVRAVPTGIVIEDNVMERYAGSGGAISINVNRRLAEDAPDMAIQISGNRGSGGNYVYAFFAAKGLRAAGNIWQDYRQSALLGYVEPAQLLRDAAIADRFVRCGTVGKVGMYIFNATNLRLDGSSFLECGDGSPNAYAISFAHGASDHISLQDVTVQSTTGRTRFAVMNEAEHRFDRGTNIEGGNHFGGLPAISIVP